MTDDPVERYANPAPDGTMSKGYPPGDPGEPPSLAILRDALMPEGTDKDALWPR